MNYELMGTFYVPVGLPYYPSSGDVSNYKSRMTFNIDHNYPVIGDAYEAAGYPHLWGHPVNQKIFHWFTINGYRSYGNKTDYMDSATTVWPQVKAYNYGFDSATLVNILGERGYVW